MGTYQGYELLAEGGKSFTFAPNTGITGCFQLRKTTDGLVLSAGASNGRNDLF